jgi:adenine-specific DNA-methyltransferase
MSNVRLELVWPNKEKFLLSPQDENGKPVWVERSHPAAREVRLTEFTDAVGAVDDQHPERDNLLFVGDSLDALRILNESPSFRREYRGKVKLIYIDPPFNTGQTFEHYDDWMEHSTWLSFMRDRLLLMKELLSQDGSIWVHLDDAEQHHAKILLDEIFGPANFISTVVWQRQASQSNIAVFATTHEYIHVYARNVDRFAKTRNRLGRTEEQNALYTNPDNDPRGPWASGSVQARNFYSKGLYQIVTPSGRVIDGPPPGSYWRFSESKFHELNADNRIWWGGEGSGVPRVKRFLTEVQGIVPKSWWTSEEVGTSDMGKRESKVLAAGGNPFATPKPEILLERILEIGSNPGEIVMDFFGGSGTTAAVAHKMQRRWVTVEVQGSTVNTFTAPRLTAVVSGQDQGGISKKSGWFGGGGFRKIEIQGSFYALTPLGIMLADDASGPRFARAVAGQLGFDWESTDGLLCARRGRMRLAVLDGAVGIEETRQIVSELDENQRVTIVARVILPGAEEWLSENSRGSICLKAPNDVLRERRKRRRSNGGEA